MITIEQLKNARQTYECLGRSNISELNLHDSMKASLEYKLARDNYFYMLDQYYSQLKVELKHE